MRLAVFTLVLCVMLVWESYRPRRKLLPLRLQRITTNLSLVVVNSLLLRFLAGGAAAGSALLAQRHGLGVLNLVVMPVWLEYLLAMLLLDLTIYIQHVVMHQVPVFWRLHRVHHCDPAFDTTTGIRFHPLEILLSMLIKMGAIVVIGPGVAAVILFEVVLNATSLFNHGNVKIAAAVDRWLRWVVVTPDMHRVHHSMDRDETDSNYGFNLPWWDRLFGTYRAQPRLGHEQMVIGLREFAAAESVNFVSLLVQPFTGPSGRGDAST